MPGFTSKLRLPYLLNSEPIHKLAETTNALAERIDALFQAGMEPGLPAEPPLIGSYTTATFYSQNVTTGSATLCGIDIPDPGVPYRIRAYGCFEAGQFTGAPAKPIITARVDYTNGVIVGRALGPNSEGWNALSVVPYADNTRTFAGAHTVYFLLTSGLDNREVKGTNFMAHAMVDVIRA